MRKKKMDRHYIYKLTFMNGCTYVGKHHQVYENDPYVTSSSYYYNKGGKDILLKREILLDNLPDMKTCEIMETICILHDRAENVNNVNYNKGAWVSNHFDRGFSGKENGMYGRSVESVVGKERWQEIVNKQKMSRKKRFDEKVANGLVPASVKAEKRNAYNKKLRDINAQIRKAHNEQEEYLKSLKHYWYYNPETLQETYSVVQPEGYVRGRLPHHLWSEERKKSYAEKHSFNPYANMDIGKKEKIFNDLAQRYKGSICYTDGKHNRYLHPGQDIPEGYYKGCTFEKTEKYISTRRKKGYKWQK